MIVDPRTRAARWLTKELISTHTRFRGGEPRADGAITLLSVNYHSSDAMLRLLRSFRKFVGADAPVVIVENGATDSRLADASHVTYLRPFANLHHGLGLDYGMRHVSTEYTLVCDPDSAIIDHGFAPRMRELAAIKGIAGIESAHWIYHPICVMFRTEWWKHGGFSMQAKWPWHDVAGELTAINRGRDPATVMARTRVAGPRFRFPIYLVEVYEDLFTNTYLGSRVNSPETDVELGLPRDLVRPVHAAWENWVDSILGDRAMAAVFPLDEQIVDREIYEVAPIRWDNAVSAD